MRTLILIALASVALAGCQDNPGGYGNRLSGDGEQARAIEQQLSEQDRGDKMVSEGQRLIEKGRNAQAEGEKMVEDGQRLIDSSRQQVPPPPEPMHENMHQHTQMTPSAAGSPSQ